jgi:Rrf2 family transcriptional regulator, nitric oxide-sensitive transcriptional repressor
MKVSMSSEMAIHAVWYISTFYKDKLAQAVDISTGLNVSPSYLVKILKCLAKEDILTSKRGKCGGFRLAKPANEIQLSKIISAVEGDAIEYCCMKDDRNCDHSRCPIHKVMNEASRAASAVLDKITIQDLQTNGWMGEQKNDNK